MSAPEELIAKAAEGDPVAVGELLQLHLPMIQAIVRRRMGRVLRAREESIDVVQSVCRQVLENRERYEQRSGDGFGAWLLKVIEHKLVDHYRGMKREKRDLAREQPVTGSFVPGAGDSAAGPSTKAADREQVERLDAATRQLTALQREALRLHHFEGLTFSAIAERLEITLKQARWNVYKAKHALARALGDEESPIS